MKKVMVFALLLSATVHAQAPWTTVADRLKQSIVFLEHCTGFVIDAQKKHILTAAHCEPADGKTLADGTPTYRLFKDERKDLMVLRASQIEKPALKLSKTNAHWGEQIGTLGFGLALEFPMLRVGYISHTKFEIESLSGPFVAIDTQYVPGQSGSPVVNLAGEVVSIVQRTHDSGFGIGVDAETIKDRVGRYFGE